MLCQSQALNKILATKDFSMVSLNNLTAEFFFNYRNEFNFIKNHYEVYHKIPDVLTVKERFPEFEIIEVSEPDTFILEELTKAYNAYYVTNQYKYVKKFMEEGKSNEAIAFLIKSMQNIRPAAAVTATNLLDSTSRYDLYKKRLSGELPPYLGTGFDELDACIGGIDPLEENMTIIARTGIGKSWILIKMMIAAAFQGKKVGLFSGEMSADKVGYRADTIIANEAAKRGYATITLHNKQLNRGQDYYGTANSYKRYFDILPELGLPPILVMTPDQIAGKATVDALRSFMEKYELDILFIDQYSLLDDTSNAKAVHEKVANISKEIKKLQVLSRKPIISVAQMNRDGQKERKDGKKIEVEQGTEQIGLTDRIGQDATVVLALSKKSLPDGTYELTIDPIKARDGGEGKKLRYHVDLDVGSFTYIPEEEKESAASQDMVSEYGDNSF